MRRVASILLVREDGRFLLQHRADNAARFPGYWGMFGGGIEDDETPEEGLLREAKEELDIDLVDYHLALHQVFESTDGNPRDVWLFVAPFATQGAITQHEGRAMGWFSLEEMEALPLIPFNRVAIPMALRKSA